MESHINDVLPDDWDSFGTRKMVAEDLAVLSADEIGLSGDSKDLFKIWSIVVNNPKLKQRFQQILDSKTIVDDDEDPQVQSFIQSIGIGENELKTTGATNKDYRSVGLLKTFDPANLVEVDYETRLKSNGKGPREIYKKRFESGYQMFVEDAKYRFPEKADSPIFTNRIAKIHATLYFLNRIK